MSHKILVRDVMSKNILECLPSETIQSVARAMSQKKCSAMLVVKGDRPVGIWTEKDVLRADFDTRNYVRKAISEIMSFPVKTISEKITLEEAALQLKEEGIRHYLVVDENGARLGIITQTDIVSRQGFEHFLHMSRVSSVVTHAPSVFSETSLSEASRLMSRYRLEALAVSSSSGSTGILSERDLVRALGSNEIPATVGEIATQKMISVREDDSMYYARNVMMENGFRHLGVRNYSNQFIGIISFSSILDSIRENSFKGVKQEVLRRTAEFEAIFLSMSDCALFTDKNRIIRTVNPAFKNLFGYASEEVIGKHTALLYAKEKDYKEQGKGRFNQNAKENLKPYDMGYRRKDGSLFTGETVGSVIKDEHGDLVGFLGVIRDNTARKASETRIKSALAEKEVLLKEVHHRVKNNLQVVSSLLRLQADAIDDEKYRNILMESQERVQSMTLVYEQLYQSEDMSHVDFRQYIGTLADRLMKSHRGEAGKNTLRQEMEEVDLTIISAIPCGLIVNELITNSLKHAFPEGRTGEITLKLSAVGDGETKLLVSDNGIGLPLGLDPEKTETLGLRLVWMLAKQLKGAIRLRGTEGTSIEIRFKEVKDADS